MQVCLTFRPVAILFGCLFLQGSAVAQLPPYQWSYGWGQGFNDHVLEMAVDPDGGACMVGYFLGQQVDFDPGPGVYPVGPVLGTSHFVAKYTEAGDLAWAFSIPGVSYNSMDVDPSGNVLVTGGFQGTDVDFDPGPGSALRTSLGSDPDGIVAKYDPAGNFLWVTIFGNAVGGEAGFVVNADHQGNVLMGTQFSGADVDMDPGPGYHPITTTGVLGAVVKYDPNGDFLWACEFDVLQPGSRVTPRELFVDTDSTFILTGEFEGQVDFDPGPDTVALQQVPSFASGHDIMLAKYTHAGDLLWAKSAGGNEWDQAMDITMDGNGVLYASGNFSSDTIDLAPGADTAIFIVPPSGTYPSMFMIAFNGDGEYLSGLVMGAQNHITWGLACTGLPAGGVMVAIESTADSLDVDPSVGTYTVHINSRDVILATYNSDAELVAASDLESTLLISLKSLVEHEGRIVAAGSYVGSPDVDPGAGSAILPTDGGHHNMMLLSYADLGTQVAATEAISGIEFAIMHDELIIASHDDALSAVSILDASGKVLITRPVTGHRTSVDVGGLRAGVYLCSARTENGELRTKKIVLGLTE